MAEDDIRAIVRDEMTKAAAAHLVSLVHRVREAAHATVRSSTTSLLLSIDRGIELRIPRLSDIDLPTKD